MLAVEFNDKSIKFMEGSRIGKILRISKEGEIDLPVGAISDGVVKDIDFVTNALINLPGNSVKHKKTAFLINSNSVFIRKIELPYVKNSKETRAMINFKLQEMLPSYFYQYKIMYKTSEIFMDDGVTKARYIVYGMPLKLYEGYLNISEKLKLNLESIDISPNFINCILEENTVNGKSIKNDIISVINVGKSSMNLSIINKGITELFRIVQYDNESTSLNEQNSNRTILKCIDEIRKYMKYYASSEKDNKIEKIYLFGDSVIDEVKENLSDYGADVESVIEIPGIHIDGSNVIEDFYNYFNLSASFYACNNHIDFLTEKKNRQKYRFKVGIAVITAILIISTVLSYNVLSFYLKTNMLENEAFSKKIFLSNADNILLNNEIENIKKKMAFLENCIIMADEIKEREKEDNLIGSEMFEKVKNCAPDDTTAISFFVDVNNVEMNCESSSLKNVALFVENLRNIEFVDNVNMTNVVIKKEDGVSKYTYAITCYLKGVDYE